MSKVTSVIGTFVQSMGNITFSKWKNKNVAKQKPGPRTSPPSPAQVAQQTRFAALSALARQLKASIKLGLKSMAQTMTEFNAFSKINSSLVTLNEGEPVIDFASIEVSRGNVGKGILVSATAAGNNLDVIIEITDTTNENDSLASDELVVAAYCPSTGEGRHIATGENRAACETGITVELGGGWESQQVHLYPFFVRADGSATADNLYANIATL